MKKKMVSMLLLVCMVVAAFPCAAVAKEYRWEVETEMESITYQMFGAVLEDELYIMGGTGPAGASSASSLVQIYNTKSGEWREGTPMLSPKKGAVCVSVGGKIYVAVNSTRAYEIEVYDPQTKQWSYEATIPRESRYGGIVGVANEENIYLLSEQAVIIYNVEDKSYTQGSGSPFYINGFKAVEHKGKIYLFGPSGERGRNPVIIYDCITDNWEIGANNPEIFEQTAIVAFEDKIYLTGGISPDVDLPDEERLNDILIYNITTDSWEVGQPSLLYKRFQHIALSNDETVYLLAGASPDANGNDSLITTVEKISIQDLIDANKLSIPEDPYQAFIQLNIGDTLKINVLNGNNAGFKWYSTNQKAVLVDYEGTVTALDEGQAYVHVESPDGKYKQNFPFEVLGSGNGYVPVTGGKVIPDSLAMKVGETYQMAYEIYPVNASNQQVTWISSDKTIATVDEEGLVTALGEGDAEITLFSEDGYGQVVDVCILVVEKGETVAPEKPDNLALLATASSSSYLNNNRHPSKANDGDAATSWMAAGDESAYLLFTFDEFMTFDQIVVDAAVKRIGNYTIEVWDGTGWIEVDSGFGIGRNYTLDLDKPYTGTGIMITMSSRYESGAKDYAIYEVEVYNNGGDHTEEPENLALNAVATASSVFNNNNNANGPQNAIDGNLATRWLAAGDEMESYLELDFGTDTTFNSIEIDHMRIGQYELAYFDGSSWVSFYSDELATRDSIDINFGDITAAKIRIMLYSKYGAASNGYQINEFSVFNR